MRSEGTDLVRLELVMDYSVPIRRQEGTGIAAVRWSTLAPGQPQHIVAFHRGVLIGLLYAEALVIHSETRIELMNLIERTLNRAYLLAAREATPSLGLDFEAWNLHVDGMTLPLWPWRLVEPIDFDEWIRVHPPLPGNPTTYTATLKAGLRTRSFPDGLWSFTEMPSGLERVLVPSAPLIAARAFAAHSSSDERGGLCVLLHHVNRYYQRLGRFPSGPSYALALSEGLAVLRR